MVTDYTIEQCIVPTISEVVFFRHVGKTAAKLYGDKFDWKNFQLFKYAEHHRIMICKRKDRPVGVMASRLFRSIFDASVKVLYQDLLFAEPGTRAAYLLMRDFIDFGKLNANHIITMTAMQTNIKGQSLEKLGFTELETLYRLEV